MKQNQSNDEKTPDFSGMNKGIAATVHAEQLKIRALTTAGFIFGLITILASIVIVSVYFNAYLPKQKHLLHELTAQAAKSAKVENTTAHTPDFMAVQSTMTTALSYGVVMIAVAVGLSALGTILILALVLVQRRATLQHINVSLAQISNQLRQLQSPGKG